MNTLKQLNIINTKSFIYALTINEKLNAFKENKLLPTEDTILLDNKWLNVRSLVPPKTFSEELKHLDITREELSFTLKSFTLYEENILISYLEKLKWFKFYKTLMAKFETNYQSKPVVCDQLILPFELFVKQELNNIQINLKNIKIDVGLLKKLRCNITNQLSKLTFKCLIVELTDYKELNLLEGKDGRDRYLNFLDMCYKSPDQIKSFYNKYPVLCRIIIQKMLDLLTSLKDMFLNLDSNFVKINSLFNINTNIIKNIEISLGDTHQHGASVAEITFHNNKKYIYKPRNLYIEKAFNTLLEFINKNSNLKNLFITKAFYGKTFTVEAFIEVQTCNTLEEVNNYYYRFGMLIALISLLNGSDMHFENIISHNQYPCIIDFETLFTQFDFLYNSSNANNKVLFNQVLNLSGTGLLPIGFRLPNMTDEIDLSALSVSTTNPASREMLVAKNIYTDDMCFVYENVSISNISKNKVTLNQKPLDYKTFKQYIYMGFNATLEWIFENIKILKPFIAKTFSNLQLRQVMKATALYGELIDYMDHPHYLRDMIKLEKLLENNWAYPYADLRLIKYEIMDMLHMEIPIFYTNTSETYLKTSTNEYISKYFNESPLAKVLNKFSKLTEKAVKKQELKLQLLLGDYNFLVNQRKKLLIKSISKNTLRKYQDEEVFNTCISISEVIMKSAITNKSSVSWEHIDNSGNFPKLTHLNNGLYSGRSGILLYFYYLNSVYKNNSISTFTDYLLQDVKRYREYDKDILLDGSSGSLYALLKCEKDNSKFDVIFDNIIFSCNNINFENNISWINGSASLVKLINFVNETKYKTPIALDIVNKILESLSTSLNNKIIKTYNLGFGNGLMGLLYSVLIGQALLKKDYGKEIEKLLNLCEEQLQNFKTNESNQPLSWNNGIVGLGIGSLACKKYIDIPNLDNYINLTTDILRNSQFNDMSLYNGLAGELDFLVSLSLNKNDSTINQLILKKRDYIVDFYKSNNSILIDELPEFRNCGLFSGLSGVGYSLLRTLFPNQLPSVLILD
ncbi:type 2 lanthipeptide synthetase LanM family protein [Clostridium felsineum]|uniref:Uncharacterized protein n=1 Tax=Clostridium felsineum TaxID=36839 RepID=A0A1S8MD17_9CLOT|nr:type 2 lanthipeptide synthetase LanM family protein [Clostridium felsineum]URZ08543.1 hypothetical protein CLROS_039250 [Clostridium felsineum]URZ13574.1 hypothetical protein CROST_043400 [Clostridium felsineum]